MIKKLMNFCGGLLSVSSIVEAQSSAVYMYFDANEELEEEREESPDLERIEYLEERIEELKVLHETPVNLSDCVIETKLATVRFTEDAKQTTSLNHMGGLRGEDAAVDLRFNMFQLLGESLNAGGHVTILSMTTGRIYTMIHSDDLEITPTQSM